jgi:hypothetical protein
MRLDVFTVLQVGCTVSGNIKGAFIYSLIVHMTQRGQDLFCKQALARYRELGILYDVLEDENIRSLWDKHPVCGSAKC